MAEFTAPATSTIVLRKRKRSPASLVLRISSSPSPSYDTFSESEYEPHTAERDVIGPSNDVRLDGTQHAKTRPYKCPYAGCQKAYVKPSRLAEHQRSHTGDRPFICKTCKKSYLRESHLQAHLRTHLPDSAKPFVCEEEDCGKRFWTTQHLHVHAKLHKGEKPFKCEEPLCDASFSKHYQLREHICVAHSPPGTKPYRCEHSGCSKSFTTNQKLRAHAKTHDDKRYTCAHESCTSITTGATLPAYFPTWSALQHHMRTAHPPTCPHASCNGKTFTAQSGLRAHLKIHAERELEAQFNTAVVDTADEDDDRPRKRRRGGEVGRDWVCEETACGKDFKSKKALVTHQKVSHLGRRDFICSHSDCQRAFGYKHLLQRHVAKVHHSNTFSGPESGPSDTSEGEHSETDPGEPSMFSIASITGDAYTTRSRAQLSTTKTLQCPYPYLPVLLTGEAPDAVDSPSTSPHHTSQCQYVFSRAYDLRRHMHAEHDLHFEKEAVEKWVRTAKQAKVDASSGI